MGKFERRLARKARPWKAVKRSSKDPERAARVEARVKLEVGGQSRGSPAFRGLVRLVEQHDGPKWSREDYVPTSRCGHCGEERDAATHHSGIKPKPGDLAVCWACAGVSRFDAELQLVKVTEAEFEALLEEEYELDVAREARDLIRSAMTGSHRHGGDA